jgi:Protein of unknown function (DUF2905)
LRGWNCSAAADASRAEATVRRPGGSVGKLLIFVGLAIAAIGLLISYGVPVGRLPGDIAVRRGNFTFYFPLMTSIILSIVFTLLLMLFRR